MNVVVVIDEYYAQYTGVMLTSLYENTTRANEIQLYVIYMELKEETVQNLRNTVQHYNSSVTFLKVNEDFSIYHEHNHVSRSAYLKINIPYYLPSTETRAVYLDGDIIVERDIFEFEEIDLGNYYVGAVSDNNNFLSFHLGVPVENYFNSGVLLIDLDKWRKHRISQQVFEYLGSSKYEKRTCDQDALNYILWDKCLLLDTSFNYIVFNHMNIKIGDSKIIHFAGREKAWHIIYPYKYQENYEKYRSKMVWWNDFADHDYILLKNKKIVIYGASMAGRNASLMLEKNFLEVSHFIDGDAEKINTTFIDKPVFAIDSLKDVQDDVVVIIPSTSYFDEMKETLIEYGFTSCKVSNRLFTK